MCIYYLIIVLPSKWVDSFKRTRREFVPEDSEVVVPAACGPLKKNPPASMAVLLFIS
ncbi:hypothetical protein AYM02_01395 [Coxiella burnetii]|uniref:Uncharacterized protein n=1 Tax=Coxiella burnetii (strain RSA 493 / Nine Mile phase I) TaxID=227377 RepID=Q83AA4_COXBU|nr:hypothetical protein [Coxiella burnetii]NP_820976.1 hypothetical protein CBU_2001 [Coxiella burnetii RSA 493]AAO91490.1 hypothetical protein CBU_2001 [Coxiella burnetii RSA 493]ACJ19251.1 hypothetical protein CbuG_2009 [Coxiella burnetii CbuG_Q212]ACJ21150.1 hypothetical protein CbuK_2051 [Coxiella burnetii CbuK_Q154]AML48028.1 hypothetical protein AUR58_01680 [Coxiella burnetii]AML54053.1 hypothetical protein AYM38_01365 [Coxiella burnetii]